MQAITTTDGIDSRTSTVRVQSAHADAIITAIEEREVLLDLLQNIIDDAPNALAAARTYIATRDL